jgi:hypothetical protein
LRLNGWTRTAKIDYMLGVPVMAFNKENIENIPNPIFAK